MSGRVGRGNSRGGGGGRGQSGGRDYRGGGRAGGGRGRDGGSGRGEYRGGGGRDQGGYYQRGGGRDQGGARGGGRGGGGRGPNLSDIKEVKTNILPAKLADSLCFYLYSLDSKNASDEQIESRSRRAEMFHKGLFDSLLANMPVKEKEDLKRMIYFNGSFFFSARRVPGLERSQLPKTICDGSQTDGDTMVCVRVEKFTAPSVLKATTPENLATDLRNIRFDALRCNNCARTFANDGELLQHCRDSGHSPIFVQSQDGVNEEETASPAPVEVFVAYVNIVLQKAMSERWAKWGREYVDKESPLPAKDKFGNDLGVTVFKAISLQFGLTKVEKSMPRLSLTCDLRAKVIRNVSVLDSIYEFSRGKNLTDAQRNQLKREWIGQVVIYKNDKKCYSVTDLLFDHSASTLLIPGKKISHAQYFQSKGIKLEYPDEKPMIAVQGRRDQTIYLPAELVAGNELDPKIRQMLPQIASFKPDARDEAIEKVKEFLMPGKQKSTGGSLLPAIGVFLDDERIVVQAKVLPAPALMAAGVTIPPQNADHWAPVLGKANFKVEPKQANILNVVVFYSNRIHKNAASSVYARIRDCVNKFNTHFRFSNNPLKEINTGDNERHWGEYEKFLPSNKRDNLFVLDFTKPYKGMDPAYPVIKQMLGRGGYLSSFVNFNTYSHDQPRDERKSDMILQGVSRQILQKCGVRLWWTEIPKSVPLPCMMVGVDVFHAPVVYDPIKKKKGRKSSVAAIIVQVVRDSSTSRKQVEIYSKTFSKSGGEEYQLGEALKETISESMRILAVNPKSVIVWRDGIGESAEHHAIEEIRGVRRGLNDVAVGTAASSDKPSTPLSYIVCQKRIATKLLTPDGTRGAPSGTLVTGLQGLQYSTFYINGRAPPYSTPKPVRFQAIVRDKELNQVPLAQLTWALCHDYPNWTGAIKVPAVCQMAHKLAELAGSMPDAGQSIDFTAFKNRVHFL